MGFGTAKRIGGERGNQGMGGFAAALGARIAVGLAFHDEDVDVVQEAIDGGAGEQLVLEERAPFIHRPIRSDNQRAALVPQRSSGSSWASGRSPRSSTISSSGVVKRSSLRS